ncbi:MAG: transposase, partial [Acetobacteraceae bacterium]
MGWTAPAPGIAMCYLVRQVTVWIGLILRSNGPGGKVHPGCISKAGNRYVRRLPTLGATVPVRYARRRPEAAVWIDVLL